MRRHHHHVWYEKPPWRGPNAVLCFVRARLRRRLFVWFAMTILMTGAVAFTVMTSAGGGAVGWMKDANRARAFLGDSFATVWDDAAARDALATTIQHDFEVTVAVRDTAGREIARVGPACAGPTFEAPVTKGGARVGSVGLCAERYRSHPWKFALTLLLAGACLWAMAGAVAGRLSRPFGEIARVATEIGSGHLDARVKVSRHHHGELGVVACAINDMAQRIEAQICEQRKLLASVSHELRTPLARIRLLTELGRAQAENGKTFDELDREVIEMDALVDDLLASSRMDFQVLSRRPVDVVEAAARALERAGEDPTKLVVESEAEHPPAVDADATLLARALANLIDNAKKHGGGLDALRIGRKDGHLVLAAEDHGQGFVEDEEERVFEPFYKRGESGNLGLGLSLVKRIAEAHEGSAFAENRAEGGARVGIELPV